MEARTYTIVSIQKEWVVKCGKVCSFLAWEMFNVYTLLSKWNVHSFVYTNSHSIHTHTYTYTTQYTTHFRDRLIFRHIWNAKWVRRRWKLKYGSGVVGIQCETAIYRHTKTAERIKLNKHRVFVVVVVVVHSRVSKVFPFTWIFLAICEIVTMFNLKIPFISSRSHTKI